MTTTSRKVAVVRWRRAAERKATAQQRQAWWRAVAAARPPVQAWQQVLLVRLALGRMAAPAPTRLAERVLALLLAELRHPKYPPQEVVATLLQHAEAVRQSSALVPSALVWTPLASPQHARDPSVAAAT